MRQSEIIEHLRLAQLPVKPRYVTILSFFVSSPEHQFGVFEIYEQLIRLDPAANLTSVYRIVRCLSNSSLLSCEAGARGYGGGKNRFKANLNPLARHS